MNDLRRPLFDQPRGSRQRVRAPSRNRAGGIVVAAVAGLALAGGAWFEQRGSGAPAAAVAAAPAAVPVSVVTVQSRDLPVWESFSGRLEAVNRVDIRPRVPGPILAAHFREGSLVKQGDLLFTIDPATYQAEVDRLDAQVKAAGARLLLASRQQQRGIQLGGSYDLAKSEVDNRVNEYQAAEANLRAATASLQAAKLNLSYTEVRAPISGRVGKIEVTAGNLVDSGATAPVLTTLVSTNPIYASFEADEHTVADAVASLPQGMELSDAIARIPVEMGTMATDGTPMHGKLQLLDNVVESNSGTVRVRAVFDNADGHLMPGQFARVRLGQAKPQPAIAVDERAIGTDQDRRFVMVVGQDNKVSVQQIVLGASIDGARIVTAGLHPGQRIVMDGLQRVRPGATVAPTPYAEAAGASFAAR